MEVGGRDKIMPSHVHKNAQSIFELGCDKINTHKDFSKTPKDNYLGSYHSPRLEKG
jgi:hypothetical protein